MSAQHTNPHLSNLLNRTIAGKKSGNSNGGAPSSGDKLQMIGKAASVQQSQASQQLEPPSTAVKLQVLEETLNEIEAKRHAFKESSASGSAFNSSELEKPGVNLPPLESPAVSSLKKEGEPISQSSVEQGASIQVVEKERSPELSPEVEKYLQEVHKDQDKAPKEIAIDDAVENLPADNKFVSEPVIVVPITPEIQKRGKRKSPKFSIRWLVEWSQKIIKMFSGKVVYLQPPSNKD